MNSINLGDKEYLSVTDIAYLLNKSIQTIHNWRKSGKIPDGIHIAHNCVRWEKETISNWLRSLKG